MRKPIVNSFSNAHVSGSRRAAIHRVGLIACILCSIVLPFYLVDKLHCLSFHDEASNSVFMNAVRFYSGNDASSPDPNRYIAIVTYIGLPDGSDMEEAKSLVDGIIHKHVLPAFRKKGIVIDYKIKDITTIRLYYNIEQSRAPDPSVYCFVTSTTAFAIVVA